MPMIKLFCYYLPNLHLHPFISETYIRVRKIQLSENRAPAKKKFATIISINFSLKTKNRQWRNTADANKNDSFVFHDSK